MRLINPIEVAALLEQHLKDLIESGDPVETETVDPSDLAIYSRFDLSDETNIKSKQEDTNSLSNKSTQMTDEQKI